MKEIFKNIKGGLIIGISAIITMLIGGIIYAALNPNWHEPETEVIAGQPLTSQAWNNMQESMKYLKEQIQILNGIDVTGTYSINRPDLWKAGSEIDFGSGLYGQRFVGTITKDIGYLSKIDIPMEDKRYYIIGYGGWFYQDNGGSWSIPSALPNSTINTESPYIRETAGLVFDGNATIGDGNSTVLVIYTMTNIKRTNSPYDVWVLYRKN